MTSTPERFAVSGPRALSITEAVRAGSIDSFDPAREAIRRISEVDGEIEAWSHVISESELLATRVASGSLTGVPVGVKDLFDTAGMPTTLGSPIHTSSIAARDSAAVSRLKANGAIVVGKTVSSEFALWTPGPTANPHNVRHSPGGSSSGSAAAVAAGMVPAALGTQTGGSITVPAAFCGVVGYKPTHGLVPTGGLMELSAHLDTVGVLAGDVDDAALVGRALTGVRSDRSVQDSPFRVGLLRTHNWHEAEPFMREWIELAAHELAKAGHHVSELSIPDYLLQVSDDWRSIVLHDLAQNLGYEWQQHRASLTADLQGLIEEGIQVDVAEYTGALERSWWARAAFDRDIAAFDVILSPSVAGEAPARRDTIGSGVFNRYLTLLHVPTIHLPTGEGPTGMPIGIQLAAPRLHDHKLLSVASHIHPAIDRRKL